MSAVKKVRPRKVNAYDPDAVSKENGFETVGESRTQQHQAAETDINLIVKRFRVTGLMPVGARLPSYGDFDSVVDYRTAMDAIIAAEKSFMALPANIRDRFDNDPSRFMEFCDNKDNLDELRKMGLAVPAAPKPDPVEVRMVKDPEPKT